MKVLKIAFLCMTSLIIASCGGGGGGSTSQGGGTPDILPQATGVNIGNIATIPSSPYGNNSSVIVTNNMKNPLILIAATYTTYDSSGSPAVRNASNSGSNINLNQCSTLPGNSSCSISFSMPQNVSSNNQFLISLSFKDIKNSIIYNSSQIISYSDEIPASPSGVMVSIINNTVFNQPNGKTAYSVPFVLTQSFNGFSTTSQYDNPAFAPSISCPGSSPYPAGTLCTLYIRIANTGNNSLISGNVIVNASNGLNDQANSKTTGIKGTTGYLFNVPVTVVQSTLGNLVSSTINPIINPANGSSPRTITLYNNGAGTISSITITAANPLSIGSNTCSSLSTNTSCSFTVNATQTLSGQSNVLVNYSTGSSKQTLGFNVVYRASTPTPALSLLTSGTLNNTVINNVGQTLNLTVKNTGNVRFNNITFSGNLPSGMSYQANGSGSGSTCAIDGTQSLESGTQCTIVLQYSPSSAVGSSSFILREAAQYANESGLLSSYTAATVTVNYSAITGNAFVYITPSNVSYAIRADGSDFQSQTFSLVNASSVSTTVNSESEASPSVTAYPGTVGGTCGTFPRSLGAAGSGTESCTITTQFGTTTSNINTTSQMTATYITKLATGESAVGLSALSFTASQAALIIVNNIIVTGSSSGTGNSVSPYQFTNSPGNQLRFTVTYRNSGTQSATNFNVALNNLPIGYYIIESQSTCGRESSTSTLAVSGTCNIVFAALDTTQFYNPYAFSGALNVNIPGYSYTDTSTGLNTNSAPLFSPTYSTNTISVNVNAFGSATESIPPNWTTATAGGTNTLTFTGSTSGLRITIPNTQQLTVFSFPTTTNSCTLTGAGPTFTCTINVQNPAGFPIGTVYFQYVISPVGSASGAAGILQTGYFTYTS